MRLWSAKTRFDRGAAGMVRVTAESWAEESFLPYFLVEPRPLNFKQLWTVRRDSGLA